MSTIYVDANSSQQQLIFYTPTATCYADQSVKNFTDLGSTSNTAGYVTVSLANSEQKPWNWTDRTSWSLSGIQLKNAKQLIWNSKIGNFVSVNAGNLPTVQVSKDGRIWSEVASNLPLMSNVYDITGINDVIILSNETGIWTSEDAVNWVNTLTSTGGSFVNARSNVYFYSGNVFISSDGYTWSENIIDAPGLSRISYGNDLFLGVCFTSPYVYISNNCVDWVLTFQETYLLTSNSVGFSNGNFVVSGENTISYSPVFSGFDIIVPSELYSFQNATFTPGGVTGRYGPTLAQARNGLTGTPSPSSWSSTYLQMDSYQGIQQWIVPKSGIYSITCAGAGSAGYGAVITIYYKLVQGQVVSIVCGQQSGNGGSGGSFVFISSTLLVASGGAAQTQTASINASASLTTKGNDGQGQAGAGLGGTGPNGGGGSTGINGAGGSVPPSATGTNGLPGVAGSGGNATDPNIISGSGGGGGWSPTSDFLGGNGGYVGGPSPPYPLNYGYDGGFGLGGGTGATVVFGSAIGMGGGGGYGGGGAQTRSGTSGSSILTAGGGGSYAINPLQSSVTNSGHGYVTIEFIPSTDSIPWSNTVVGDTFTKIANLNESVIGISKSNVWYSANGIGWNRGNSNFSSMQDTFTTSPSLGYSALTDGQYSYLTIDGKYVINSVTNSGGFQQVVWSPQLGLYVGTGEGLVSVSNDGKNWTSVDVPLLTGISAIEWSSELGIFLVYCYGNVFISNDGYSWSRYPGPNQTLSNGHKAIVWANSLGIFTIGGRAISKNGVDWQTVDNLDAISPLAWSQKLGIITSGKYYSRDGLIWTTIYGAPSMTSIVWSPKLNIFIAVDDTSKYYTSSDSVTWSSAAFKTKSSDVIIAVDKNYSPYGMISYDSILWENLTSMPAGGWASIIFANGVFVACGGSYVAVSSDGGHSWTTQYYGASPPWDNITYANGVFVVVGSYYSVLISSNNGLTWTRKSVTNDFWWRVAYGNSVFLVTPRGSDRCLVSADNGNSWTTKGMYPGDWTALAYGQGAFVALGLGDGRSTKTTNNGNSWTTDFYATPAVEWSSMIYVNGLFVAVGTNAVTRSNNIGQTWTTQGIAGRWNSVTYNNGKFIAVSSDNILSSVITSPDGINWTYQTSPYGFWYGVAAGYMTLTESYTFPVITWSNELGLFVAIMTKDSYTYVFTSKDGISFTEEGNFQTFNQPLTSLVCSSNAFLLANGSSFFISEPIVSSW